MNPALAISLGLSATFLALAHGCLHYFLWMEKPQAALPLKAAFLPWPARGRGVSLFALTAALVFFWAAILVGFTPEWSGRAVLVFVIFASPLLAHLAWLAWCIKRTEAGWAFLPAQPSARTIRFIVGLPALVAGAIYIIQRLT